MKRHKNRIELSVGINHDFPSSAGTACLATAENSEATLVLPILNNEKKVPFCIQAFKPSKMLLRFNDAVGGIDVLAYKGVPNFSNVFDIFRGFFLDSFEGNEVRCKVHQWHKKTSSMAEPKEEKS